MKIKHVIIRNVLLIVILSAGCFGALAQDNTLDLWTGIKLQKELTKSLDLYINPEWRLNDGGDENEFLFETGLAFEPLKFIEFEAKYRLAYQVESDDENIWRSQVALDLKGKFELNRFDFQLRARLTNYTDFGDDDEANPYLRYRFKTEYNIPKSAFTPVLSIELFHQLKDKEINKIRYTAGVEYKFNKHNFLSLDYSLQDYLKKEKQRSVIAVQYKYKF